MICTDNMDGTITVEKPCFVCREMKQYTVGTSISAVAAWVSGTMIQEAMPKLNATEREFLISGVCYKCQDDMFSEEDDG